MPFRVTLFAAGLDVEENIVSKRFVAVNIIANRNTKLWLWLVVVNA